MNKENELVKVETLPTEIKKQVECSGVELSKAEIIASNYVPFMADAQRLAKNLKGLDYEKSEDVAIAKRTRLDLGKLCSSADKQKKSDKDILLVETRFIDGLFNVVNGFARLTQKDAEEIEKKSENLERERVDKLNSERIELVRPYLDEVEHLLLHDMEEDVFQSYLEVKKRNFKAIKEAEAKEEAERLEKIEAEKKEQQRIKLENEQLKKEAEEKEALRVKEEKQRKRLADIEAKKREKEETERQVKLAESSEKQNAILRKEREENERLLSELKTKQDKEKAEIKAKLEAEELAKLEAEKLAKAPIKKQLNNWVEGFKIDNSPVENQISTEISAKFNIFKKWALTEIEKL